jgi:hypothetical protein
MEPVFFYMLDESEACRVAATTPACKNGCVFLMSFFFITYSVDIMGFFFSLDPPNYP